MNYKIMCYLFSKIRFLLVGLAILSSVPDVSAQFDTEFYMPPVWEPHSNELRQPADLQISTAFPIANVNIRTPDGTTINDTFIVGAGSSVLYPLDINEGMTNVINTSELSKGLIITSDFPIQVSYRISSNFNQVFVTLKGQRALGTRFYAGSQTRNTDAGWNDSQKEFHFISVMATENNTSISISLPSFATWTFEGGMSSTSFVLNSGETRLIRTSAPDQSVAASLITSDKPIAVISGSQHTRILGSHNREGGIDQLVPEELTGSEYILVRGGSRREAEYANIVATRDNTDIFIDGSTSPATTINQGEIFTFQLTSDAGESNYIQTSAPVYVYQHSGIRTSEIGMAILPPLFCAGSKYIEFNKLNDNITQQLNVVIPTIGLSSLVFNEMPFSSLGITPNPVNGKPDHVTFIIPGEDLDDRNVLTSDVFLQAGFLSGANNRTGTYGFLSGFGSDVDILDPETLLPTTMYFVDSLFQGQTGTACLLPESCAPPHFAVDIENSPNTGGSAIAPPAAPYDTCVSYTASNIYTGRDTIEVTLENQIGFRGRVKLIWHVLSALDLRINPNSIAINPPRCPATDFDVSFNIQNVSSSAIFDGTLAVSFYQGNPATNGATYLGTENLPIGLLNPGGVFSANNVALTGDGSPFDLYIVINDDGSSGLPISLPSTDIFETNYDNNIGTAPVSPLPFSIAAWKLRDNEKCVDGVPDNGVAQAAALVGSDSVTAGYTFHWLFNGAEVFSGAVFTGMAEGTYQVYAINNLAQCSSDTVDVTIGRISDDLNVTIEQINPQTNCDNPNGILEANVEGETTGYQFTWYLNASDIGDPALAIGAGPRLENLEASTYFVSARATFSGCEGTNGQAVEDETVIPVINLVGSNDVTTCDPVNGSLSVNANGLTDNFTFTWTDESGDIVGNNAELLNVGPGDYTVVAKNDTSGCESLPATFTINDLTPPITIFVAATDPGVCVYNSVTIEATVPGGVNGFEYEWYIGSEPLEDDRRIGNGAILEDLNPGTYTVVAVNQDNGCSESFSFFLDPLDFAPSLLVTTIQPQDQCFPPNGQIEIDVLVTDVNGVDQIQNPALYNFYLFEGENAGPLANADYAQSGNNIFPGLESGKYTIQVEQNFGDFCVSIPFLDSVAFSGQAPQARALIDDPANCLFEDGAVRAVDDLMLPDVSYTWYATDSSQIEGTTPLPQNTAVISGINPGFYTVVMTNNTTNCTDTASVELVGKFADEVQLNSSGQPVDLCYYDNGSVASFASEQPGDWQYVWFDDANNIVGQLPLLDSIAPGTYRVQLRDTIDNVVCATDMVTVDDIREYPRFTINKDADITICDPDRPDGQLSIMLQDGGLIQDHFFNWTVKDDPNSSLEGPIISGLTDTTYQAVVTNIFTGCSSSGEESVDKNQIIPVVDPEVLAGRTDCLTPNGAARASVQGDTTRYNFSWYVNNTSGDLVLEESYGNELDSGRHVVTAVDKLTGCASLPQELTIPDLLVYPQFSILSEDATCDLPDGSARIVVENTFAQKQVIWNSVDFAGTQIFGNVLENALQGEYTATVTTIFNCSTTEPTVIGEDINIFNLVTVNNDGENDIFIIDCIENFENNIVRIYNRYGTLVYEVEGYDNVSVFFDGIGNNGVYAGDNELPVGTYFYIVDKRDGTEPKQGFLELLR